MARSLAFCLALVVCGAMAAWPLRSSAAEPAKSLTADQVKALIAKLGDADFKVRDAAQKDLVHAGPAALDALEQAAKSGDAEVKQRAAEAIKQIKDAVALADTQEMAKNYVWSHAIQNGAIGSPVVLGGMAYVVGQGPTLHAVDIKTGKEAWSYSMPTKGSPLVSAGEKVIALTVGRILMVVSVMDGNQLWQKDLRPATASTPAPGAGQAVAPASLPPGQAPNGPPGPVLAAGPIMPLGRLQAWVVGDAVVVRIALNKLKAFKALTGDDAWEMEVKPAGFPMCNTVVAGGVAYTSEGASVTAIDLSTRKRLWSQEVGFCTGLARGGQTLVCRTAGKFVALETKKGEKAWAVDWNPDLPAGPQGPIARSRDSGLVVDDARLYTLVGDEITTFDLNNKGKMTTAKLDLSLLETEGGKDAANSLNARPQGGAGGNGNFNGGLDMARWTACGGTLYVDTVQGLFAFDGKDGRRLWVLPLPTKQMLSGAPVVADGVIYFATTPLSTAQFDEKTLPKDLPGLHAVKLKIGMPATAPAKASDGKP
jgi:outer membrane protein assembly factor BamB